MHIFPISSPRGSAFAGVYLLSIAKPLLVFVTNRGANLDEVSEYERNQP